MSLNDSVVADYRPLTAVNRTHDFELPDFLELGGELVAVPSKLRKKDVHYLLDNSGEPVRACWLSKPLGFILNGLRLGKEHVSYASELNTALERLDEEISNLVKNDLLKGRAWPGAMSFAQTNDNVASNELVISERSYQCLCQHSNIWEKTRTVSVVRYPNLGPNTTTELKLVVNCDPVSQEELDWMALGLRVPKLAELLTEENVPFTDCFLLNHSVLKGSLEGDSDGDILFIKPLKRGKPRHRIVESTRIPGELWQGKDLQTLFTKCERVDRNVPLTDWLPSYLDDKPIGKATYVARWATFKLLPKYRNQRHPMYHAWKEFAPEAIELIEFVMDVRKGSFTKDQINAKAAYIDKIYKGIAKAKKAGNWFAQTVTANRIEDVAGFVKRFASLREYLKYITGS